MNVLIAYFSASGTTKKRALLLKEMLGCDLYEIKPEESYTKKDLNWLNKNSRSSIEMKNKEYRPQLADRNANIENYDVILLGFPIWWYAAPTIINTFLESYDFSGKTIITFATSGSSGFGDTLKELELSAKGATLIEGKVLNGLFVDKKVQELIEVVKNNI